MTFTWISNSNYDIFEKLLGVPDYLIETPLAYENILIKNYIKTPLAHGFYKNEIYGTNVNKFDGYVNEENIKRLVFTTEEILTIYDVNGIIELLSIVLFKKYAYTVDMILHEFMDGVNYFTPKINLNDVYTIDNISINIDNFIGYVPLLSDMDLGLDVKTSDFIFLCNIERYHYEIIEGIVVIKIGSNAYQELKSQSVEDVMNDIDVFASQIKYYMQKCFLIDSRYEGIMNEFIQVYEFVFVKKALNGQLCYKHDFLTKRWVLDALDAINNNELPTYLFNSDVYETNLEIIAKLQYCAIRAVITDNTKSEILSRHLHQITGASDGTISVPILSNDISTIKNKINLYMKGNVFITKVKNESDGINTEMKNKGISFTFKVYDQWMFGSNVQSKIYTTTRDLTSVRPLSNLQLPLIDLEPTEKMGQEQIDYLWINGKLLTDWAYYYYTTYGKISKVALLDADSLIDPFGGN